MAEFNFKVQVYYGRFMLKRWRTLHETNKFWEANNKLLAIRKTLTNPSRIKVSQIKQPTMGD